MTDVDASQCGIGDVGASALASAIDDARAEAVERVVHGANAWSSRWDDDGMSAPKPDRAVMARAADRRSPFSPGLR